MNEAFVRKFFNGANPIGAQIAVARAPVDIVGVVQDVKYESPRAPAVPMVYMPAVQDLFHWRRLAIVVRFSGAADAASLSRQIRAEVKQSSDTIRIARLETLQSLVDRSLVEERLAAELSGVAGMLAMVLVSVGLFGTVSDSVARRTREVGIRMAIGARRGSVFAMVIREMLLSVAAGIAFGIPLALGAARMVASKLFGVQATDPLVMGAAFATMTLVAFLAGCAPAYRATRVNPIVALRYE